MVGQPERISPKCSNNISTKHMYHLSRHSTLLKQSAIRVDFRALNVCWWINSDTMTINGVALILYNQKILKAVPLLKGFVIVCIDMAFEIVCIIAERLLRSFRQSLYRSIVTMPMSIGGFDIGYSITFENTVFTLKR